MGNTLSFGDAEIFQVPETSWKMPVAMFGASDAQLERHRHWLQPTYLDAHGEWDNIVQSWVLVVDGRVIVVDPCTGNGRHFPDYPPAHMLDTPYIERFAATGIRPEQVDYVFCTHLHMDHCGWNTQLVDGRYVPTFPNAKYVMVQREFERWDPRRAGHVAVSANAGTFENSVLPVLEAGLAQIVPDTFRISASLDVAPAWGHTAGHSLLHLDSAAHEAYFVGDAFHHPLELLYPELDAGTCEDFSATLATRRRLIETCLASDALLVPAHFPCPFGVTLQRDAQGELSFTPCAADQSG
ncbi:MBL fold metallo-hydrolase [Mangrovimicrobium sediminis]|uniref:MBL fold metallo-hydrolase n=1 Tax=Mangrovimicrobium sediminis TaxID=2562682 RepID=A0A4Z0M2F0_9GAMM|nr:MBL fold metallo-hydrolase [Haliea sp. SAOS-164]TGD73614.1 MBL fold metallo-hydrolase [Haliea sp. SAOS-164]